MESISENTIAPMPYPQFQSLITTAANRYLAYIEMSNRRGSHTSRRVIQVLKIEPGHHQTEFFLTASEKFTASADWQVFVRQRPVEQIKILTVYKSRRGRPAAKVHVDFSYLDQFLALAPQDMEFIYDLSFLIARLRDFYQSGPFSFVPPAPQPLPELPEQYLDGLSVQQRRAVDGVSAAPVSYVSGAPGTGKTKKVLSRCVLRYVQDEQRVFLLAPTNNAVEQMLRGILPELKSAGIPLDKAYRIGTSSDAFAAEYPQVVGDTATDSYRDHLAHECRSLKEEQANALRFQEEADRAVDLAEACGKAHQTVPYLLQKLRSQRSAFVKASVEAESAAAEKEARESVWAAAVQIRDAAHANLHSCKRSIEHNSVKLRRCWRWPWKRQKKRQLEEESAALLSKLSSCEQDLASAEAEVKRRDQQVRDASRLHRSACSSLEEMDCSICALTKQIHSAIESVPPYAAIVQQLLDDPEASTEPLNLCFQDLQQAGEAAQARAKLHPIEPLRAQLRELEEQLADIAGSSKQLQQKNALILAGTVDSSLSFIRTYRSSSGRSLGPRVSHVFLDEAGYTSIARGMAAFAFGAPVTFLGDHNQLPPVCEMGEKRIEQEDWEVSLWAQSVASYPELIYGSFDAFFSHYVERKDPPTFRHMDYFSLDVSYRFGPFLAEILAHNIYGPGFTGVAETPFEVLVVDAVSRPGLEKRTNLAEAAAVEALVKTAPGSDLVVLTPYKNQQALIRSRFPWQMRDSVMTVHRAQGQEWDTVVLSPSDTPSNAWFTNSHLKKSRGLAVLNTAISRAKHRLVLVCDVASWSQKPDQLICELIRSGIVVTVEEAAARLAAKDDSRSGEAQR